MCTERPRRQAAIEAVRNAVFAGETAAQCRRRHASLLKAQEDAAAIEATEAALEEEVTKQAAIPPLSLSQWQAHVISFIGPSVAYFNKRLNDPSGDRFVANEVFKGASLIDPIVAKNTSHDDAMKLFEKLRAYPVLNKEGEGNIVNRLKHGYRAYRMIARRVPKEMDYSKDNAAILSWHYKMNLGLDKELAEDSKARSKCRYCGCRNAKCNCNSNLRCYWEAARLLSLLMPSSGAAERVFSILNNHFNKQQSSALGDMLYLSLFLAYNKRGS